MVAKGELRHSAVDPLQAYQDAALASLHGSALVALHDRVTPRTHTESGVLTAIKTAVGALVEESLSALAPYTALPEGMEPTAFSQDVFEQVARPPKTIAGERPDFAIGMFPYARHLRLNPAEQALRAEATSHNPLFDWVKATGPYVNLRLEDRRLYGAIDAIVAQGQDYGALADHQGEVVVIDYSSPNMAKPFGPGHLRSTVIGESVSRLLNATGHTVVRTNHLGDWGVNFGNILAAHEKFAPDTDFETLSIEQINELYVRFNQVKEEDLALKDRGREIFIGLEAEDPELLQKWSNLLQTSQDALKQVYQRLNINFDAWIGERFYETEASRLAENLADTEPERVVRDDDGSIRIKGTPEANGVEKNTIMLKTEAGYPIYAARDLAAIALRSMVYKPTTLMYVVGNEQAVHFDGVFDLAQATGLNTYDDGQAVSSASLEHINFGMLRGADGKKMSTRSGTSGRLEDILSALDATAFEQVQQRNPQLSQEEVKQTAEAISVAALVWNDLQTDRKTDVRFDIDRMLSLGGQSVINVLYSYSRSTAIIDQADSDQGATSITHATTPNRYSTETEHHLAVRLQEFSEVIRKASNERAPHVVVGYLRDLAVLHGSFYEESRVFGVEDDSVAKARLDLHRAYRVVVSNGLNLLNIPVLNRI